MGNENCCSRSNEDTENKTLRDLSELDEAVHVRCIDTGRCPNGHVLYEFIATHGGCFYCDRCGSLQQLGTKLIACRPCRYDICNVCRSAGAQRALDLLPPDQVKRSGTAEELLAGRLAAVRQEGVRRGAELRSLADAGGICYICSSVESPEGDVHLLVECVKVMHRDLAASYFGKLILSAGDEQIAAAAFVPEELHDDLSCEEWLGELLAWYGGKIERRSEELCAGSAPGDGKALLKPMLHKATDILQRRGLLPQSASVGQALIEEFTIELDRSKVAAFGVALEEHRGGWLITEIRKAGLFAAWNEAQPDRRVQPGDVIAAANGVTGQEAIDAEMDKKRLLRLLIRTNRACAECGGSGRSKMGFVCRSCDGQGSKALSSTRSATTDAQYSASPYVFSANGSVQFDAASSKRSSQADMEEEAADRPGLYRIVIATSIRETRKKDSEKLRRINPGAVVEVLEVVAHGGRIQGRLQEPRGYFVNLAAEDGSRRWARPVTEEENPEVAAPEVTEPKVAEPEVGDELLGSFNLDSRCTHGLERFRASSDRWPCSECQESFSQGSCFYGCRKCNYDQCPDCSATVGKQSRRVLKDRYKELHARRVEMTPEIFARSPSCSMEFAPRRTSSNTL